MSFTIARINPTPAYAQSIADSRDNYNGIYAKHNEPAIVDFYDNNHELIEGWAGDEASIVLNACDMPYAAYAIITRADATFTIYTLSNITPDEELTA